MTLSENKNNEPKKKLRKKMLMGLLAIFCLLFFVYAFVYEPYFGLRVEHTQIESPTWRKELANIKIALVSDLHMGALPFEQARLNSFVKILNEQKPDIVFFVGDFVNGYWWTTSADLNVLANILSEVNAPLGKFAVSGNHDEKFGVEKIINALSEKAGIKFLTNDSVKVETSNGDFYVAGISDISSSSFSLKKAFAKVPNGAPCIFLTHGPNLFPALPKKASVVFAGHTHGGQIRLPFFRSMLSLDISTFGKEYGLFINYKNIPMFVTRGIGTSTINARLACLPCIDIIKLVPEKK